MGRKGCEFVELCIGSELGVSATEFVRPGFGWAERAVNCEFLELCIGQSESGLSRVELGQSLLRVRVSF